MINWPGSRKKRRSTYSERRLGDFLYSFVNLKRKKQVKVHTHKIYSGEGVMQKSSSGWNPERPHCTESWGKYLLCNEIGGRKGLRGSKTGNERKNEGKSCSVCTVVHNKHSLVALETRSTPMVTLNHTCNAQSHIYHTLITHLYADVWTSGDTPASHTLL